MEKDEVRCGRGPMEADLPHWGSRKRTRCSNVKNKDKVLRRFCGSPVKRPTTSRLFRSNYDLSPLPSDRKRRSDSPSQSEKRRIRSPSLDKEDRYYTTRGSVFENGVGGKLLVEGVGEDKGSVWPRFYVALSSQEKEEDFMKMKGCRLPQRPKKRAKLVQKTVLLVCPGTWLSEISQERYEVREKKSSKRRPRGLKAMRSMETDSDCAGM